jgi:hypothetical protein
MTTHLVCQDLLQTRFAGRRAVIFWSPNLIYMYLPSPFRLEIGIPLLISQGFHTDTGFRTAGAPLP